MRLIGRDPEQERKIQELQAARKEIAELAQNPEVARMMQLLEVLEQNQTPPPNMTNLERMMTDIQNAHTEDECVYAKNFILRVFADCIVDKGGGGKPHLYFARIKANDKTRERGLLNPSTPNGFMEYRGIDPHVFSLYYIDVILEGRQQEKTDHEIVWDMIDYSQSNPFSTQVGVLHPEFAFLVGEGENEGEQTLELWTHNYGFEPGEE